MINSNIYDSTKFFAATNPVQFKSTSKIISVEKISVINKLENRTASYDYLYPEYKVNIKPAYKDFVHTISAIVDEKGNIFVYRFTAMDDYRENRKKVLQGILNVYLKKLLVVKPGNTLGFTHSSVIVLDLIGKK